jgi:hypothetical protein
MATLSKDQRKSAGKKKPKAVHKVGVLQLIDLDRHKSLFGGEKGVADFVALLEERFRSEGEVLLCVGERVIAQITSHMDASMASEARLAAKLAKNPELLAKLEKLVAADDFHEEGTFSIDDEK